VFLPFSQPGKSWEPKALELRRLANVSSDDLLDPWSLAPNVGLMVVDANDTLLQSLTYDQRLHLLGTGAKKWSGGVLPIPLPDGTRICILNPTHSKGRRKSTLMEEIAHAHLNHRPTKLICDGAGLRARDYNKDQETEAFGVGAAALLPWSTFYHQIDRGKTRVEIAEEYRVSEELVRYRIQVTGAHNLYRARQRAA
jgi:hypothetical protein